MQFKNNLLILTTFLVLFVTIKESRGQTLYCYVCENCEQVTKDTPLQVCNADFFNPTERPPTTETTETTTDSQTTETIISTSETVTTEAPTTETSSTSSSSTGPSVPTPPTAEPPQPTTLLPTPPNPGVVPPVAFVETFNATNITQQSQPLKQDPATMSGAVMQTTMVPLLKITQQPSTILVRQRREVFPEIYTYHCYVVKKSVNGSSVTSRGCSRINGDDSVCDVLKNETKIDSCFPCQNPYCNSSTSLALSVFAMVFALITILSFRSV